MTFIEALAEYHKGKGKIIKRKAWCDSLPIRIGYILEETLPSWEDLLADDWIVEE